MPIHEFRCMDCDYKFELLIMSKKEMDSIICPRCESPNVHKLMSVVNMAVDTKPRGPKSKPALQHHSCKSGSCATIDIPGYER
jgi:putative FmdB family regulatory protein